MVLGSQVAWSHTALSHFPLAVLLLFLVGAAQGVEPLPQWLLISSPSTGNIYYASLPNLAEKALFVADRHQSQAYTLIDGSRRCSGYGCAEDSDMGLRSPRGLAVYAGESLSRATLYVSDTEALNIYAYELTKSKFGWLTATSQRRVLQNIAASHLAVDAMGNLYFTVTDSGQINTLTAEYLAKAAEAAASGNTLPEPEIRALYSTASKGTNAAVVQPTGIVADNFFVYWANHGGDESTGTLVKAPDSAGEDPASFANSLQSLAANTEYYQAVASNLCLARDTVFFTGETASLYAVKSTGGVIAEIAKNFSEPKGCVYDDEGTLYVADAARNAVYSLAANFAALRAVRYTTKMVQVPGADQIVIFGASTPQSWSTHVAPSLRVLASLVLIPAAVWLP